ncbi:MAG TPA: hypothetical protein ENK46_00050 [Flavobacteriia bacterium]|nr:hypothetical protein [Flavobacteriia bacterium]
MLQKYCILLFLCCVMATQAQTTPKKPIRDLRSVGNGLQRNQADSTKFGKEIKVTLSGKTHYTDYKIISHQRDTTYIDTTLTIQKDYLFNYLRKDNFELLPFHNQGQTFNKLGYTFSDVSLFPKMGATAKHYNYYELEDVYYYHVPTPTTELFYRTGLEQGQVLDALFTFNTTRRHNISLAYKGMRSLGKYINSLSSHGNLRFTFSYRTKNDRYTLRSHIVAQDLSNDENGGLTPGSIIDFESNDPNFSDRARLETNFNDAKNILRGNRYYLEHDYKIWHRKDSLNHTKSYLKIGHILNYERKHYDYEQATANTQLGPSFSTKVDDKLSYLTTDNQVFLALKSPIVLGELIFKANYFDYQYGYKSVTVINNQTIPSGLNGTTSSIGGEWKTTYKKFAVDAEVATLLTGDFNGNYVKATASYKQDSLFTFKGTFLTNSKSPNLNFLLHQSDYVSYNWFNNLKNERTRSLLFDLTSRKLLNASVQITQIDNFTYFSDTTATRPQPLPEQFGKTVSYLKVKVSKEFRAGKFALNNTIMYQNVAQGGSVFRVPEFVTRNTLYFSDHLFKGDPMYLQAGITFTYFSEYFANGYNPLLGEFTLQNAQKIGNYPVLDFFINAQIQRTRLYLKAEHFNSSFSKNPNYYAAPNYPYRDFVVRFGLVWNFFI